MNRTCIIGNINSIGDSHRSLLTDTNIDVLVTGATSFDSCFHVNFEKFKNREYSKCILFYDLKYGRYYDPDFGEPCVVTEDSEYSEICFIAEEHCITGLENEWYMFKLFVQVCMACRVYGIELSVVDNDTMMSSEEFVKRKLELLGPPVCTDSREGFSSFAFQNSFHHEYVTDIQNRKNLLIFPGDSWAIAYNLDTLNGVNGVPWHPGLMSDGYAHMTAEHFDADLVVCGSTYGSNPNAVITMYIWCLLNPDFTSQYNDVKIVYSSTTFDRDLTVYRNIGPVGYMSNFILSQKTEKLYRESRIAVQIFDDFCMKHSIPRFYLFNHCSAFHSHAIPEILNHDYSCVIAPKDHKFYNYRHFFRSKKGYTASCSHPNRSGNEYIAKDIISILEGTYYELPISDLPNGK